jgi:hypothetical protein
MVDLNLYKEISEEEMWRNVVIHGTSSTHRPVSQGTEVQTLPPCDNQNKVLLFALIMRHNNTHRRPTYVSRRISGIDGDAVSSALAATRPFGSEL